MGFPTQNVTLLSARPPFQEMARSLLPSVTMAPYGAGTGSDLWQRTISLHFCFSAICQRIIFSSRQFIDFWTYAFSYEYLYCSSSLTLFCLMENCKFFKYIF